MTKKLLVVSIISVILAGLLLGAWYLKRSSLTPLPQAQIEQNVEPESTVPQRLRLIGNGDLLPHDSVNQQAKTADGYDYQQFFDKVKPFYQAADVRFCNQEATSAGGFAVSGYPAFNAPPKFAQDLSAVGCNVISLANNHMNDKGQSGIDQTRRLWEELKPLAVAGANRTPEEQRAVGYFELKGVKFAFVAYTEISNNRNFTAHGLNSLNDSLVSEQLSEARSKADIVLVGVHWGTEYSSDINAAQERWANRFAELGVDIVLGSGPHVLQPVKRLPKTQGGETIVYYSLGNLLSTQLDTESLIGGFAVVDIDPVTKKIITADFLPTYMHYEWTAQEKAKEALLARRNLKIYPLDTAAEALARSQNNTTVEAQIKRITGLLNRYTQVNILKSTEY